MSTAIEPRVYSVREAARLAGISEWLAGEEIRRTGTLAGVRCIRIGRHVLVPKEAFDRILAGVAANDGEFGQSGPRSTPVEKAGTEPNRTAKLRATTRLQGLLEYADETVNVIIDFRFSGRRKSGRFLIVAMILAIQAAIVS